MNDTGNLMMTTGYPDMPVGSDQMMPATTGMPYDPSSAAYPSTYPTFSPEQAVAMKQAAAGAAIFGGAFFVVAIVFAIIYIIAGWKIFTKAGQPGWAVLIPIYNFYIILKIIGRPSWWLLGLLAGAIPFVGPVIAIVLGIVIALDLAKSFGKSQTFGIVGLWLFSFIGVLILAFDSSKYLGPAVTPPPATPAKK